MLQEKLPQNYVFVVEVVQSVFSDSKLANVWRLEEVGVGLDFEYGLAACLGASGDKEAYWLDGLKDGVTLLRSLTEIPFAVEVFNTLLPLLLQCGEKRGWYCNHCGSSIDHCWECPLVADLWNSVEETFA